MEIPLQFQRPVFCRQTTLLNFRPSFGLFSYKLSSSISYQSYCWHSRNGSLRLFCAAGDSSRKKKSRKSRSKGIPPKGSVPKAPVGTDSKKKDRKNDEENQTVVNPPPEHGNGASDEGLSTTDDRGVSEISQVNISEEQPESKKTVTVSSICLLKEPESVREFIEAGKRNVDREAAVYIESRLDGVDLADKKENSSASEIEALGSETRVLEVSDISEKEPDCSVNQQSNETDKYSNDRHSYDIDSDETETVVLCLETRVSDVTPYEGKVKDIVTLRENSSLLSQSIESDMNAPSTGLLVSEIGSDESVTETDELESGTRDAIGSDEVDMGLTLRESEIEKEARESRQKLEMEKEAPEFLQRLEMEKEAQESLRKLELKRVEVLRKQEMEKEAQEFLKRLEMEKEAQESLRKLELEREELLRKEEIQNLAESNFSKGNKMFFYPKIVKPDEEIQVFFNRDLSTLSNESDVIIMGAFNDWRWNSFTVKLEKANLNRDWWSCRIHVPKEAYIIDFVLYDGEDAYDNNSKKDFHIPVEGGMDTFSFDDFLLEEKRRELEKLAKVQAERETQVKEQKKREEEKAAVEADRAQAKVEVEQRREKLKALAKNAKFVKENVWYFEPHYFNDGDLVRLFYNKSSGPLAQAHEVWVHGGHDGWAQGLSVVSRLVKSEDNADWWNTEVTVPDEAIVLDWVFANGPPGQASVYDNNNSEDFHAIIPKSIPDELYWVEEEARIYQRLQHERRSREEAIFAKVEKTARMKAETKERTLKTFLLSQRHIVYTDPVDVKAGKDVTVYYNPPNTALNGKSEVWFRGSFNRLTHRRGPLPPQRMLPVENGLHVKTSVKVPLDAYMMDFVFSEKEDGGIFDNKSGMDYHVPVFGGVAKEPLMHIVHIAVEMAPIAKVGGLGDVVTSLSRAVQELNHHVYVVLPKYDCINIDQVKDFHYERSFPWGGIEIKVWSGKVEGLSVYLLDPQNGFFRTSSVYVGRNDGERFGFFCHAALEFLLQSGFHPDIIHCHDWSSAPVAWLYKEHYGQYGLTNARVVFTIHNLEFGAYLIGRAMAYADKATTVSNTYAKEVAGNPAIAPHLYKFHGILNGIDPVIWDPYNNKFIPVPYTSEDVIDGKRAAKETLQQRLSLKRDEVPIIGIITRLTHQKGIHLIKHAIWRIIERGGQVVLLGSAPDPRIQQEFVDVGNQLHNRHHGHGRLCLNYDEPLSHLIYAGADFILVPSLFEPCGLTQLVAMRYGSIPVVRKTGGLYDTVFDVDHDIERAKAHGLEPNGFTFEGADQAGVDYAVNRAISTWYDAKDWLNSLRKRVMEQDWSWNRPALEYMELYHAARKY